MRMRTRMGKERECEQERERERMLGKEQITVNDVKRKLNFIKYATEIEVKRFIYFHLILKTYTLDLYICRKQYLP